MVEITFLSNKNGEKSRNKIWMTIDNNDKFSTWIAPWKLSIMGNCKHLYKWINVWTSVRYGHFSVCFSCLSSEVHSPALTLECSELKLFVRHARYYHTQSLYMWHCVASFFEFTEKGGFELTQTISSKCTRVLRNNEDIWPKHSLVMPVWKI